MLWEIAFLLLLILGNAFFVAAEIAIIAARRGRLEQRVEEGSRNARWALELSEDPNQFLSTAQIGITVISVFGAAYGGQQVAGQISEWLAALPSPFLQHHAESIGLGAFVLCYTIVSLIVGELLPKRAALHQAESLAIFVAPVMRFVSKLARPLIWIMGLSTDALLWTFRLRTGEEPSVSIDDIEHLIDTGTEEGLVEPLEKRLALGALRLGDRTVRDIMRPRIDLDAMDVETPPEEVMGTVAMAGFSRLPVYEGDLDHIIGFVHIKDLFRQVHLGWKIELRKQMHPALFVPETMQLDRLLELFQAKHNQLAVVLNEYGGTEGMVTLEDVVEEIVGEIRDEHRHDDAQRFVHLDDGSWSIDGGASMADFIERLDLRGEESLENRSFSTVGGLILDQLGQIPSIGDSTDWNGLHLEVVDMDGQRIDRILVTRTAADEEEAAK